MKTVIHFVHSDALTRARFMGVIGIPRYEGNLVIFYKQFNYADFRFSYWL